MKTTIQHLKHIRQYRKNLKSEVSSVLSIAKNHEVDPNYLSELYTDLLHDFDTLDGQAICESYLLATYSHDIKEATVFRNETRLMFLSSSPLDAYYREFLLQKFNDVYAQGSFLKSLFKLGFMTLSDKRVRYS
jgi:hypothetical protein